MTGPVLYSGSGSLKKCSRSYSSRTAKFPRPALLRPVETAFSSHAVASQAKYRTVGKYCCEARGTPLHRDRRRCAPSRVTSPTCCLRRATPPASTNSLGPNATRLVFTTGDLPCFYALRRRSPCSHYALRDLRQTRSTHSCRSCTDCCERRYTAQLSKWASTLMWDFSTVCGPPNRRSCWT